MGVRKAFKAIVRKMFCGSGLKQKASTDYTCPYEGPTTPCDEDLYQEDADILFAHLYDSITEGQYFEKNWVNHQANTVGIDSNGQGKNTLQAGAVTYNNIPTRRLPPIYKEVSTRPIRPQPRMGTQTPTTPSTLSLPRSPSPTNKNKPLPPVPQLLDPASLLQALDTFHAYLHTRYAVSGLAALAVWGYIDRLPNRVTIMCRSADKVVIRTWAKVSGWFVYENQPDIIGMPGNGSTASEGGTRGSGADGVIRRVRLRGVERDDVFEWQGAVCPATAVTSDGGDDGHGIIPTKAKVLTLTMLLDQYCDAWRISFDKSNSEQSPLDQQPQPGKLTVAEHAHRAAEVASLILWILKRMVTNLERGSSAHPALLPPGSRGLGQVPHAIYRPFLTAFTTRYPDSAILFAKCGLDVSPSTQYARFNYLRSAYGQIYGFGYLDPVPPLKLPPSQKRAGGEGDRSDADSNSGYSTSSLSQSTAGTSLMGTPLSNNNTSKVAASPRVAAPESSKRDGILTMWGIPDDLKEMLKEAEKNMRSEQAE